MTDAIAAPRWSYDLERRVIIEPGISDEAAAALSAASIEIHRPSPESPFFGSVKAITVDGDGRLGGFADPRRDAAAGGI
jgi:gamma-glutamyltranspeptidase